MAVTVGDHAGAMTTEKAAASGVYVWAVILLFGLANATAFMDRSFLTLVAEPLRLSLKLSDVEIGALIGPAFILFYSIVALPIGWMSDRFSRKNIILSGLVFWSACVSLTGLCGRYWQLVATRMGLGVGEATLSPAAISIISDLVPRHVVSRAVALFIAIGAFGAGFGAVLGGLLLGWLAKGHGSTITLPLISGLLPWQQAFVIMGLPGLALAVIMLMVLREPKRFSVGGQSEGFSWGRTVAFLVTHRVSTLYVILGFSLVSMLPAVGAWTPTFLIRSFGWTPARVGPAFGLVLMLTNPTGIFLGGLMSDLIRRRGREDANLWVILVCLAAALPFFAFFPVMPNGVLALWIYAPANFLMMVCFGASTPVVSILVPRGMRAQALAIMFLTGNLMGALGPMIFPVLTQYVFHDPRSLRYALIIVPLVVGPAAMLVLLWCRPAFLAQVIRTRMEMESHSA
jgi:MFS family permease